MTANNSRILVKSVLAWALLLGACALPPRQLPSQDESRLARFETETEDFRTRLGIPGMSAVIVKDQEVLWAKGFGYADFENRVPATPDTVYHIASFTKTFAATLIMQLVEQGKLDLDEPMSHYSDDFKDDSVRIKHLLSHTSAGATPGEHFEYDGQRFDYLTAVIEKKTGKPFRQVMVETFLDPLGMSSSVPGADVVDDADKWAAALGKENLDRYRDDVLPRQAKPYTYYGDGEIVPVGYPPKFFGAAAGLLSTVLDLARYDIAIDRHVFLKKETQEKAWTPFISTGGQRLPYGFGWFVEDYHGVRLIWHTGHWGTGFSGIYLKVPEKNLSLVLYSNSEALADHIYLADEEPAAWIIKRNVFACSFLRLFVSEDKPSECERESQAALASWKEHRRARAHAVVQVDPKILEAYVGQYQFEFDPTMILTMTSEG
ncbi:MAG TPA: serine hydrolase domain-containing protein, partial [Thermoanaerobaculia bacterium]|nr:serine hydrolase domain-containing protein [Thermoanaerobaculia bacterium]